MVAWLALGPHEIAARGEYAGDLDRRSSNGDGHEIFCTVKANTGEGFFTTVAICSGDVLNPEKGAGYGVGDSIVLSFGLVEVRGPRGVSMDEFDAKTFILSRSRTRSTSKNNEWKSDGDEEEKRVVICD